MNELEMILNAIQGLGETAVMGVVWYLVYCIVKVTLCWAGGIAVCVLITKTIIKIVSQFSGIRVLRDMLDIGCAGSLTCSEERQVFEKIGELMKQNEEEKCS